MVEKVIITPESIRGGGNIISPATSTDDYTLYQSGLEATTDTVGSVESEVLVLSYNNLTILLYGVSTRTIGESLTGMVTVLNQNEPVSGLTMKWYLNGEYQSGKDSVTDSDGNASFTITPSVVGAYSLYCEYSGDSTYGYSKSNTFVFNIVKISTNLTLNLPESKIGLNDSFTVSGVLTGASGDVNLYVDNTLIGTVTPDSTGAYSYTMVNTVFTGDYPFYAVYDGDSTHESCESGETIRFKDTPVLTCNVSASSVQWTESVTVSGKLTFNGSGLSNKTVIVYYGSNSVTVTTDSTGAYSKTLQASAFNSLGSYNVYSNYNGDSDYNTVTTSKTSVSVVKAQSTLTCYAGGSQTADIDIGGSVQLNGQLTVTNSKGDWYIDIYTDTGRYGTIKSQGGVWNATVTPSGTGTFTYYAKYTGATYYEAAESDPVTVTVNKYHVQFANLTYSTGTGASLSFNLQKVKGASAIAGASVTLKMVVNGNETTQTITTGSNGEFSINTGSLNVSKWSLIYEGDDSYDSLEWSSG